MINQRFRLENYFQEILRMIDVWVNEGSVWIVESIESQYINISTYRPLSGSPYINLPVELKSPRKRLINIKNKDRKNFYGAMLGILILQKKIRKELKQPTKKFLQNLIMMKLSFLLKKKILAKFSWEIIFALMCLVTTIDWLFRYLFQIKNLKTQWICYF